MNIFYSILIAIYIVIIVATVIVDKKQMELFNNILLTNCRLVNERKKIVDILINSEIKKENFCITLEKIKKELV